ncbi:MAG TPA: TonB-dependent receptor [Gemmatimonadaceae bacterium]|nr:TonB-dependent receptor [Gemmatimonadaceae bacterium]
MRGTFVVGLVALPLARALGQLGTIHGRVIDDGTGRPLGDAVVQVDGTPSIARSESDGSFMLRAVPNGAQVVVARRIGFAPARRAVFVQPNDTVFAELRLKELALALAAVTVHPVLPAFDTFQNSVPPGALTLPAHALRDAPAAVEPDVLRAVGSLPGVVTRSDNKTGFSAQGGEEDQNLTLLDGIPMFSPDHFGGLFGTFIPTAVDQVRLQEAGFPARYGGRMSSVLDVTSAEDTRPGTHGTANLSLLSSNATLGGAIDRARGSWNVAVRRTYADALERAFTKHALPYHFLDGQAHLSYETPSHMRVAATVFHDLDVLDATMAQLGDSTASAAARLLYERGNDVAGLSLSAPVSTGHGGIAGDSVVASQSASMSRFASTYDQGAGSLRFESGVRDARLAGSLARYGPSHVVRAGYDIDAYRVHYRLGSTQTATDEIFSDRTLAALALFAEDEWHATSKLVVQPGARFEQVSGTGWASFSPRLSMKYFFTPSFATTVAAGRYAQWLQLSTDETATMQLFDYWVPSGRDIPVAVTRHFVVEAERWFGDRRFVSVQGYYKPYSGLNGENPSADLHVPASAFLHETGTAYGATLLLRQEEIRGVAGSLSYTYGLSTRRHADTSFFPLQDRRHTLNALATLRSKRGVLGVAFSYGTGTPYTRSVGEVQARSYDPTSGAWLPADQLNVQGPYNGNRYPPYSRLDLSLSREYRHKDVRITPSLSVVNVLNRRNVFRYFSHYAVQPPTRTALTQFPILPTIAVKVEF